LFIGDTYFKQHQIMFAGEWFAQAIQIDPNKETAYRYWGDALLEAGKLEEGRSKYIEAIVADPYNQNSWNGLKNWLGRTKLTANWLKLNDGVKVQLKDGGNTDVTLDSSLSEDVSPGWMMYGMNRSLWMSQKFKKEFPKETTYRHCLPEETESLSMLLEALNNGNETKGTKKLNKSNPHPGTLSDFEILRSIQKAGFLEPFVLLNRADNGIAQDYPAYRNANREKVRRYLDEFVVPKTPPQPESAKN
jgi:tetratricopeptide (TPR) repeat protein